jgi:hypothetical protein
MLGVIKGDIYKEGNVAIIRDNYTCLVDLICVKHVEVLNIGAIWAVGFRWFDG